MRLAIVALQKQIDWGPKILSREFVRKRFASALAPVPFSFDYGGKPSRDLLAGCETFRKIIGKAQYDCHS